MKIEGLSALYQNMRTQNIKRTTFQYRHNNVYFDVMFIIDSKPFKLLFGAIGHGCGFYVNVKPGFEISPAIQPSSAYYDLCKALGLTKDSNNPFSTKKFFEHFAAKIPTTCSKENTSPLPSSITPNIDSVDKTFFSHWKNNSEKSGNVTDQNLAKTLKAFGSIIKDFCKEMNISSCWSVIDKNKKTRE